MSQKSKIAWTAVISVVATFLLTSVLYLTAGSGIIGRLLDTGSTARDGFTSPLLDEVKTYLDTFYMGETDEQQMYYYAAKGMAASTEDPYTRYYSPTEFKEYMDSNIGAYVGVGIVLSATQDTNELVVVMPYEGAPGDKAGVLPGDIITAIDGKPYTGDDLDEAADTMRGSDLQNAEGTQVTLTLRRDGGEPFDVVLTREEVHLKTVSAKMLEGDVGYMRIISFDGDTDVEVEEALQPLLDSGMKKLVLDLRDNGGGDYNTACGVAGKFLDEGQLIVYTEDKNGKRKDEYASGKMTDCELVILINGGSASASEVVTGALDGNNRAKAIVGTKSYGKGITQNVYPLKNGGGMSITVDYYYTPTGECIHKKGIEPDYVVPLGENEEKPSTTLTYEEDLQLQKAVELLR